MGSEAESVQDLKSAAGAWWVLAMLGALSIIAGVIVLAQPSISLSTLAVIAGIFLLVDGLFEVSWSLFDKPEDRGLIAIFGAVTAIAGVILIRHPTHAIVAIALLLGLWLIVAGLLRLIRAFGDPARGIWSVLLAALELIAGIVIVSSPDIGVATLALLIGLAFIVRGSGVLMLAWTVRALGKAAEQLTESPSSGHRAAA